MPTYQLTNLPTYLLVEEALRLGSDAPVVQLVRVRLRVRLRLRVRVRVRGRVRVRARARVRLREQG